MNSSTYHLVYSGHWDRDAGLDMGRLSLNCLDKGNLAIWQATSSIATRQTYSKQFEAYGCIPANNNTATRKYHILTTPEDSRHVKGVEGSFYRIYPNVVKTTLGTTRTALGIHKDANQPGSLGCIVMSSERFSQFEEAMKKLRLEKVIIVPLQVQYS
jgi:hypothetical protein